MVGLKDLGNIISGQFPKKKKFEVKKATGGTSDALDIVRQKAFIKEKIAQARKEGREAAKKKPKTIGQRYQESVGVFGGSEGASSALGFEPMQSGSKKKKFKEEPYRFF